MALPVLPALHPRMANEQYGPTVVRQLEPPGFLGLHYGIRTPISVLAAHAIFGAILGAFYTINDDKVSDAQGRCLGLVTTLDAKPHNERLEIRRH